MSHSAPLTSADFRKAMGCFATGIAIVSIKQAEEEITGLTINSLSSVSLEPPLLLWCLGRDADKYAEFMEAEEFGINVLSKAQGELSRRCATPEQHQLAAGEIMMSAEGIPLLRDALAGLACRVQTRIPAGDHVIVLAEVLSVHIHAGDPLIYYRSDYRGIGA